MLQCQRGLRLRLCRLLILCKVVACFDFETVYLWKENVFMELAFYGYMLHICRQLFCDIFFYIKENFEMYWIQSQFVQVHLNYNLIHN